MYFPEVTSGGGLIGICFFKDFIGAAVLPELRGCKSANRKILENLIKAGAFDFAMERRDEMFSRVGQIIAGSRQSTHHPRCSVSRSRFRNHWRSDSFSGSMKVEWGVSMLFFSAVSPLVTHLCSSLKESPLGPMM